MLGNLLQQSLKKLALTHTLVHQVVNFQVDKSKESLSLELFSRSLKLFFLTKQLQLLTNITKEWSKKPLDDIDKKLEVFQQSQLLTDFLPSKILTKLFA